MLKVHAPNMAKLHKLQLHEHELVFDSLGWANADHLNANELERLRKFHFVIEQLPDPQEETISLLEDSIHDAEEALESSEDVEQPKTNRRNLNNKKRGE